MTTNPKTTNDAAREIAELQQRRTDLLDEAGRNVLRLEIEIAAKADALCTAITSARSTSSVAADVARALAEHRVNVGELSSQLADALERRGHRVFPHRYEPIRAMWALVSNTNRD